MIQTMKSKKYAYTYEQEEEGKCADTMIPDILADPELPELEELIIGTWGDPWNDDDGAVQKIIDGLIEHADQFSHIRHFFIGDMDYEECEVSWIVQGNYEQFFKAFPDMNSLIIKGSMELVLGEISHENLESLTIICGGLPADVIADIEKAHLPNLKELNLYLGVEDYGFDGDIETIKSLLANSDFPQLAYLGLGDSEIEDEVAEAVLNSKYAEKISILDLSNGTLTDKGGQLLLDSLPSLPNIQFVNLCWNFLSDEMAEKLQNLPNVEVNTDDRQEEDRYGDEVYRYPMLTE